MATTVSEREHQELLVLYQVTVSDLAYFKSQQWSLTNYALLLYAALAGASQLAGNTLSTLERTMLVLIAASVCIGSLVILSKLQDSVRVREARLDATRARFGPAFSEAWAALPKSKEYLRAVWLLAGAVLVGPAVVAWLVLRQ